MANILAQNIKKFTTKFKEFQTHIFHPNLIKKYKQINMDNYCTADFNEKLAKNGMKIGAVIGTGIGFTLSASECYDYHIKYNKKFAQYDCEYRTDYEYRCDKYFNLPIIGKIYKNGIYITGMSIVGCFSGGLIGGGTVPLIPLYIIYYPITIPATILAICHYKYDYY